MVLIKQNSRIHSRNRTRVNRLISYVIPRQNIKQINIHQKLNNNNIIMSQVKVLERKPRYVRINTLIKKLDEAIEDFQDEGYIFIPRSCTYHEYLDVLSTLDGWKFTQDYHIPELLVFASGTTFYDHLGYKNGAIILQDKASCLPAYLLNPESGSNVLDMCAAPGMKTTHLAAIIDNKGKVFSVERCQRRYEILCNQVSTTHANCVETMNVDAMTLNENKCPDVEYILVDPSCSGSGMQRFTFEGEQSKCAPGRLRSLQSFQVHLLRHALTKFSKVKRVVYSTCSIYPEENEMVVDEVLTNVGDAYKLVPVMTLLNDGWINLSSNEFKCKDNCLYAKPEVDYCNGFFVAVFERNFDVPLPEGRNKNKGLKRNAQDDCDEVDIKEEQSNDVQIDDNGKNLTVKVEESDEPVKKKRKKNKNKCNEVITQEVADEKLKEEDNADVTSKKKIKKEKKIDKSSGDNVDEQEIDINSNEMDIVSKKKHKKKKKDKINEEELIINNENEIISMEIEESNVSSKKKKHKKNKKDSNEGTIIEEGVDEDSTSKKKHKKKKKAKSDIE
ncbi:28S rRNA (cytosine-C(5))-methyltransferase [Aphidius gifuensis]|uniref:28S rRNA (cytosine-C(5))-methyltransferase n=1 Tax=Aphidius gifuensis TaxID=684658 RepID=UPI001CDBE5DB|nr:28S rRNA (cytosine-C(5))-methyltransferase [Aphidius gifuensis]